LVAVYGRANHQEEIQKLENRIAALESPVAQAKEPRRNDSKNSGSTTLVGNWAKTDTKLELGLTGLRFDADGSCRIGCRSDKGSAMLTGTYEAVGAQVVVQATTEEGKKGFVHIEIIALSENEMTVRCDVITGLQDREVRLKRE
jgi:hypothetical protein